MRNNDTTRADRMDHLDLALLARENLEHAETLFAVIHRLLDGDAEDLPITALEHIKTLARLGSYNAGQDADHMHQTAQRLATALEVTL